MRTVGTVVALAAALIGAGLAGCSAGGTQPTDASASPSPSAASAPGDLNPPVRDPRNLVVITPCLLLTPTQLETNRIDQPGRPKDVVGSAGCEWENKARTRQIAMFVDVGNDVLTNVYAQRAQFPVFEITEVAGHLAIRTKDKVDGTACYYRVAAAQKQTLIVRFDSLRQGREEPCGQAQALAATVIGNLPPLNG